MNAKDQSLLLGGITIFCWGSLATFGKLLSHLPPFYVLGVSFLFRALPGMLRPRELFPSFKITMWGVFGYFGYHFFLFSSFRFAPALEANLINYLWPVIMVLISPIFFKNERLRWFHLAGASLAIVGSFVLVFGQAGELSLEHIKGHGLAFMAALIWPAYSIGKKLQGPVTVWAVGGFCLGSAVLCFITHFLLEPRVVLQWHDAWKLFAMGLGPFGVAFYAWDMAIKKGDTKVLGAMAYLTPVLSTLNLILFGNQPLSLPTGIAMILIVGGASAGLLDFLTPKR